MDIVNEFDADCELWKKQSWEKHEWYTRFADFYLAQPAGARTISDAYLQWYAHKKERDPNKRNNKQVEKKNIPRSWFQFSKKDRWLERAAAYDENNRKQRLALQEASFLSQYQEQQESLKKSREVSDIIHNKLIEKRGEWDNVGVATMARVFVELMKMQAAANSSTLADVLELLDQDRHKKPVQVEIKNEGDGKVSDRVKEVVAQHASPELQQKIVEVEREIQALMATVESE